MADESLRSDDLESAAAAPRSPTGRAAMGDRDGDSFRSIATDFAERLKPDEDGGDNALVTSAKELGEATASLPVVSTLSFGFAIAELLAQNGPSHPISAAHPSVLLLLALSASCSLYTTTFSLLEFYYLTMLSASDTRSRWLLSDRAHAQTSDRRSPAPLTRSKTSFERGALAQRIDREMLRFSPWRKMARNLLWVSVMLIIAAAATQTALEQGVESWTTVAILVVLGGGALLVPVTVMAVRLRFQPLLEAYRRETTEIATRAKYGRSLRRMPSDIMYRIAGSKSQLGQSARVADGVA